MNSALVQISVNNVPNVDRISTADTKNPIVYQEQNADLANHEALRKTLMPVEPEQIENKNIDLHKNTDNLPRKNKEKSKKRPKATPRTRHKDGTFIDVDA